jgi:hypothetical protein
MKDYLRLRRWSRDGIGACDDLKRDDGGFANDEGLGGRNAEFSCDFRDNQIFLLFDRPIHYLSAKLGLVAFRRLRNQVLALRSVCLNSCDDRLEKNLLAGLDLDLKRVLQVNHLHPLGALCHWNANLTYVPYHCYDVLDYCCDAKCHLLSTNA